MLPTKLLDLKHQYCGCAPVRVVWKQKEWKTIMTAVLPIFATDSHSFRCWNFGSATRSVLLVATNFGPNHDLCNVILKQMKVSPILLDELAKDTSCRAMLKNLRIGCSETQQSERVCQCIVLKQTVRNHCLNNQELWLLISHLIKRSGNPVQFNTVLAGKFRNYAPRVHFWHLTASGTSCLTSWTYKSRPYAATSQESSGTWRSWRAWQHQRFSVSLWSLWPDWLLNILASLYYTNVHSRMKAQRF